ncbi:MAG TPA: type III pantothenate kinase, partial [Gammaproteobacteria bacterium]
MKLFIDIGNSRLKWGAWDGADWQAEGSVAAGTGMLTDWIESLQRPDGIWIASVSAEESVARVADACAKAFGVAPVRLATAAETRGVRCAYAEPARLGVDRWLAVVAAFLDTGGPAIVFDCGTAITVDAVTASGEHLGGLIVPGIGLMRRALYGSTAGIPDEGDAGDVGLLARDTRSAVSGGSLYAAVAFMQHVAAELRANLGAGTRVLVTG